MKKLNEIQKNKLSKMFSEYAQDLVLILEEIKEIDTDVFENEVKKENSVMNTLRQLDCLVSTGKMEKGFNDFNTAEEIINGIKFKSLREYELKRVTLRVFDRSFGILTNKIAEDEEKCKDMFKTLLSLLRECQESC